MSMVLLMTLFKMPSTTLTIIRWCWDLSHNTPSDGYTLDLWPEWSYGNKFSCPSIPGCWHIHSPQQPCKQVRTKMAPSAESFIPLRDVKSHPRVREQMSPPVYDGSWNTGTNWSSMVVCCATWEETPTWTDNFSFSRCLTLLRCRFTTGFMMQRATRGRDEHCH